MGARLAKASRAASPSVWALAFRAAIPIVGFLAAMWLAQFMLAQVSPQLANAAVVARQAPSSQPAAARLTAAMLAWAGGGFATLIALGCTLCYALWVICVRGQRLDASRSHRQVLRATGVGSVVMALVLGYFIWRSSSMPGGISAWPTDHLFQMGVLRWDLSWFTRVANTLTVVAIACLFFASAVIAVRSAAYPAESPELDHLLVRLLALGAISTVLGVLEIGALHRLPALAVDSADVRSAEHTAVREAIRGAVRDELAHPDGPSGDVPSPLLIALAGRSAALDQESNAALRLAQSMRSTLKDDTARRDMIAAALADAAMLESDQRALASAVSGMESVAASVASYWGIVFTTALVLLYVPTALMIASHGSSDVPALSKAFTGSGDSDRSPLDKALQPMLRILAAIAPILAAAFGEFLKPLLGIFVA